MTEAVKITPVFTSVRTDFAKGSDSLWEIIQVNLYGLQESTERSSYTLAQSLSLTWLSQYLTRANAHGQLSV